MVLVRKFFCFDLYTTGLLIGWLGLAESITSCIFSILLLENIDGIIRPEQFPDANNIEQIRMSKWFQMNLCFHIVMYWFCGNKNQTISFQWFLLCLACTLHLTSLICWLRDYSSLELSRYFTLFRLVFLLHDIR